MPSMPHSMPHMPPIGCDELVLIPIVSFIVYITHGHSSYLCICKNFRPYLPFKDLAYEIKSKFCWLMFFKGLKLRFELEKLNKKFILDLAKFQVNFSLIDFNFYFLNNFKMNLNFNFIKFPTKSKINALNSTLTCFRIQSYNIKFKS